MTESWATYHCKTCAVEWKHYKPTTCWSCGEPGLKAAYSDENGQYYHWTSFTICYIPLSEAAE